MLIIKNFKYSRYSTDIDKTVLTYSSTFFFKNKIVEGITIFEVILHIYLKNVFVINCQRLDVQEHLQTIRLLYVFTLFIKF